MLTIHDLNVSYGERSAIRSLDLSLANGEILGLIGPNGAGKTSLIRALSGVLPIQDGAVQYEDQPLLKLSEMERARLLAVVPQSSQLPPAFSVYECVALGRTPHLSWLGKLGERDRAAIDWAMQACEIAALGDRRAGELSGGEQQRVLLARALAQDCPVLLLDEPTAHLDLHNQVALLSLVQRLSRQRNLAVLIAMHDLNLAALYADRLALLVEGRLQAVGAPHEVLTADHLQRAFQVPLSVYPNPTHDLPWVVLPRPKL
jgi:iron complex transport system ATP-binding protein